MPRSDSLVNHDEWLADFYFTTPAGKGASFEKRVKTRVGEWRQDAETLGIEDPVARLRHQCDAISQVVATVGVDVLEAQAAGAGGAGAGGAGDAEGAEGAGAADTEAAAERDATADAVTGANALVRQAFGYPEARRVTVTRGDEEVEFSGSFSAPQSLAVIDAMPVAEAEA
ncbi:MAG: hypothetical protein E7A62_09265, partial [Actinomycetaceae bacterium]|nr:hypothetical protein [Actinomycetaceae bacterium]MDU0971160.1 hypothetical protein [Actinomycetaceae bacterium]